MSDERRGSAKARLGQLIQRVMADGTIDEQEREELQAVYREAGLTVGDVREVLGQYLTGVQDDVLADGRVTDEERRRCRAVVSQLRIPTALLSQEMKAIIGAT